MLCRIIRCFCNSEFIWFFGLWNCYEYVEGFQKPSWNVEVIRNCEFENLVLRNCEVDKIGIVVEWNFVLVLAENLVLVVKFYWLSRILFERLNLFLHSFCVYFNLIQFYTNFQLLWIVSMVYLIKRIFETQNSLSVISF